ncbi:MAG: hypothetical protein RR458_07185 [Clostridia bacterium]
MYKIWNKVDPIKLLSGEVLNPQEMRERFTEANATRVFIGLNSNDELFEIDNTSILENAFGIAPNLSDAEFVKAFEEFKNRPTPPPTPQDQPANKAEVQALGRQMTDLELLILSNNTGVK